MATLAFPKRTDSSSSSSSTSVFRSRKGSSSKKTAQKVNRAAQSGEDRRLTANRRSRSFDGKLLGLGEGTQLGFVPRGLLQPQHPPVPLAKAEKRHAESTFELPSIPAPLQSSKSSEEENDKEEKQEEITHNRQLKLDKYTLITSEKEVASFEKKLKNTLKTWSEKYPVTTLWKNIVADHVKCYCWRSVSREFVKRGISNSTSIGDFRQFKKDMLDGVSVSLRQECTLYVPQRHVLRSLYERCELFFSHENNKCTAKSLQFCFDLETLINMLKQDAPFGNKSPDSVAIYRRRLNEMINTESSFSNIIFGILGGKKGALEYRETAEYWREEAPQPLLKKMIQEITNTYLNLTEALKDPFSWSEKDKKSSLLDLKLENVIRSVAPNPDSSALFSRIQVNDSPVKMRVDPLNRANSQHIIFTRLITSINKAALDKKKVEKLDKKKVEKEVKQQVGKLLGEKEIPCATILRLGTINSRLLAHEFYRPLMSKVLDLKDVKLQLSTPSLEIDVESFTHATVAQSIGVEFKKIESLGHENGWIEKTLFEMTYTWKLFLEEVDSKPMPLSGKLFMSVPEFYEVTDDERTAITQNLLSLRKSMK